VNARNHVVDAGEFPRPAIPGLLEHSLELMSPGHLEIIIARPGHRVVAEEVNPTEPIQWVARTFPRTRS
jgi:hypothetical protein